MNKKPQEKQSRTSHPGVSQGREKDTCLSHSPLLSVTHYSTQPWKLRHCESSYGFMRAEAKHKANYSHPNLYRSTAKGECGVSPYGVKAVVWMQIKPLWSENLKSHISQDTKLLESGCAPRRRFYSEAHEQGHWQVTWSLKTLQRCLQVTCIECRWNNLVFKPRPRPSDVRLTTCA